MKALLAVLIAFGASLTVGIGSAAASPRVIPAAAATQALFALDPLQEELAVDAAASSTDPGTKHIGPVPSSSGDSGTCGPDWAQDTFDRFFTIRQTGSTPVTYTVYEQFKNGTFVTYGGFSPGACDFSDGYGPGVVAAGLTGTMHGYEIINVVCADPALPCLDASAACGGTVDVCQTTADFIAAFFPGAASSVDTYFFHYAGYDGSNQALLVHEWKNASCNRGGNHGDIATATTTTNPFEIGTCL